MPPCYFRFWFRVYRSTFMNIGPVCSRMLGRMIWGAIF